MPPFRDAHTNNDLKHSFKTLCLFSNQPKKAVHDVSVDEKYQRHWPPIIQMDKRIKVRFRFN